MADFNEAFDKMIELEGGYVNDSSDTGGETKFGLSKKTYPNLNIPSLSIEQAYQIYHEDWWQPFHLSEISSQAVANQLFHINVNVGTKNSTRLIQRALRAIYNLIIDDDGIIGPETIKAINSVCIDEKHEFGLLCSHKAEVANYYRNLNRPEYLKGWLNRIYK
jgi:lysozyme family protein